MGGAGLTHGATLRPKSADEIDVLLKLIDHFEQALTVTEKHTTEVKTKKKFDVVTEVLGNIEDVLFDLYFPEDDPDDLRNISAENVTARLAKEVGGPIYALAKGVLEGREMLLLARNDSKAGALLNAMEVLEGSLDQAKVQVGFRIRRGKVQPAGDLQILKSAYESLHKLSARTSSYRARSCAQMRQFGDTNTKPRETKSTKH